MTTLGARTVTIFLDGRLVRSYPLFVGGELIGGPLTTDGEYARAAQRRAIEEGFLQADQAERAEYMVEGQMVDPQVS